MKKLLIILIILCVIGVVLYFWWMKNAERIVTSRVQELAQEFFVNTENIVASHEDITILSWNKATVGKLKIGGENLELKGGGRIKNTNIILEGIHFSMPPARITGIDSGTYMLDISTEDINSYLRSKKGVTLLDGMVPVSSIRFAPSPTVAQFSGVVEIPFISKVPWTVTGKIDKSSDEKGIDFIPEKANISKVSLSGNVLMKAVSAINPVVDVSSWPVDMTIKKITSTKEGIRFNGDLLRFKDGVLF